MNRCNHVDKLISNAYNGKELVHARRQPNQIYRKLMM